MYIHTVQFMLLFLALIHEAGMMRGWTLFQYIRDKRDATASRHVITPSLTELRDLARRIGWHYVGNMAVRTYVVIAGLNALSMKPVISIAIAVNAGYILFLLVEHLCCHPIRKTYDVHAFAMRYYVFHSGKYTYWPLQVAERAVTVVTILFLGTIQGPSLFY